MSNFVGIRSEKTRPVFASFFEKEGGAQRAIARGALRVEAGWRRASWQRQPAAIGGGGLQRSLRFSFTLRWLLVRLRTRNEVRGWSVSEGDRSVGAGHVSGDGRARGWGIGVLAKAEAIEPRTAKKALKNNTLQAVKKQRHFHVVKSRRRLF